METILFYDCEIIRCVPQGCRPQHGNYQYCRGWGDYVGMGISVVGVALQTPTKTWYDVLVFDGTDGIRQRERFKKAMSLADRIVGFNSQHFDDQLMQAHGINVNTDYDLLKEVRVASGQPPNYVQGRTRRGYNLGNLAKANLGASKAGDGADAPKMWQDGQRQQVIDYCRQDTRLLVELYNRRTELKDPTNGKQIICRD